MMRVFKGLDNLPPFKNPVLTIGTFDGVHLGHAKIIERLRKKATEVDGESIIITFDPHPRFVVAPNSTPIELLSTSQEKIKALQALHVDNVVIVPFTKAFSDISAEA
jgi:cytidyltransferase-like protein